MIETAVVLAAGRGTRLGEVGRMTSKALLPVAGVAAVDRVLAGLAAAGIGRCVLVTGHRADEVETHVARSAPLPVVFARQEEPLGTGHAVLVAGPALGSAPFLFSWVDVVVAPETYSAVLVDTGEDGALAVNAMEDQSAGAAVVVAGGLVTSLIEKPQPGSIDTHWNNAGVGVLGPGIWQHIRELRPSPRGEIELPEAIGRWIEAGARVKAVEVTGPWFEIGTAAGLAAAESYFG